MSSQILISAMSVVYLLLGGRDAIVRGIFTPDGYHVFSIYEFLEIVLIGNKNRTYVKKLWKNICRQHPHFMEVQGTLALAVPSTKMPKTPPTAGTTILGLKGVLDVLGNFVTEGCRKAVEDIFARYMAGDMSMLVHVNLNATVHPQIPPNSYNFQPPTVSSNMSTPVPSSRESSTYTEFDFTSTEDHIVRGQV